MMKVEMRMPRFVLPIAFSLFALLIVACDGDGSSAPATTTPAIDDGRPAATEAPTLEPGARALIPIGLAIAIEPGFEGQIRPRSGLACRFGVTVPNAPGTIDADYRGEIKVGLINLGSEPFVVEPGTRIAQLVIAPVARVEVLEVEQLDETVRGTGGFGSTGVR